MGSTVSIPNEIKKYWSERATGALFLKLSDQRLLQVFFLRGQVKALKCQSMAGANVIKAIPDLIALRCQFHPGATTKLVNELPSTEDIIEVLFNESLKRSKVSDHFATLPTVSQQAMIGETFTHYVGPIADIILPDCIDNSENLEQLITNLSHQISDYDMQNRFREEVKASLRPS